MSYLMPISRIWKNNLAARTQVRKARVALEEGNKELAAQEIVRLAQQVLNP